MKRHFYKSWLLIIIYMTVTILLLFCLNIYNKSRNSTYREATYISDNCVKVVKYMSEDLENWKNISLNSKDDNILLFKLDIYSEAVGYNNEDLFDITLKSGRKFNNDDFINKTNTVIVGSSVLKNCEKIDGIYKYYYESNYYDVIGVIDEDSYSYVNDNIHIYFNAFSDKILKNSQYLVWDYGKNSYKIVNDIIDNDYTDVYKYNTKEYIGNKAITNSSYMVIVIFIIMIFLIFISVIQATENWFDGRKKEYMIRMLLGQNSVSARRWVEKLYIIFVLLSFILGCAFTKVFIMIFTKYGVFKTAMRLLNTDVGILNIIITAVFLISIGFITCIFLLWKYFKKGVINITK